MTSQQRPTTQTSLFRLVLAIALCCFFSLRAAPANGTYHVHASATGDNSGSDWNNAYTQLPDVLERSATYFIGDGTYSGYNFNDAQVGSQLITIKKATNQEHGTNTGWQASIGDGQAVFTYGLMFSTGFYVIDGQKRENIRMGHGFKVGPTTGKGVQLGNSSGVTNITLKYLEIEGIGKGRTERGNDGIYAVHPAQNILIHKCSIHDLGRVQILTRSSRDITIEHSYLARNESTADEHSEAWSDANSDDVTVRYNFFEDIEGTAVIAILNANSSQVSTNWKIHGNVFFNPPGSGSGIGAGSIVTGSSSSNGWMSNSKIYNNTFVNLNGSNAGISLFNGSGNIVHNNLFFNNQTNTVSHSVSGQVSHNLYGANNGGPSGEEEMVVISADPFVNWQAGDFRLSAPTAPGIFLGSEFSQDGNSDARGADGVWDRGAFEFTGAQNTAPSTPVGLRIISIN